MTLQLFPPFHELLINVAGWKTGIQLFCNDFVSTTWRQESILFTIISQISLSVYCVPDNVLSALNVFSHLI